ncbi:TolC family protein [Acidithiobacillus thiooxidans]|uniref:RND efflux system outer membrane lipoprotein TolC3 n=1 Tax=Acidithiobacillus thiooxidans TaxID=930 RepID=B7SUU2_ACITH|nr:TolC family protein [Acidithiobacillus thiooxidans]ACI62904.1 RND efflux system outer membrane lipoprotein TolC3 [Acidithiobacillus thiooxidans]MBU2811511.1 TolC family protein [Acidithiobacillus thiooxidans]
MALRLWFACTASLLLLLTGCAHYQAAPLPEHLSSRQDLHQKMAAALARMHPHVQSMDLQGPFSGKDLGTIAVLLNPQLRAMRANLGVARAQVFAAGLLPDPQLSLSADLPSNVAAGYYNAYSMGLSWSLASLFTRSANLDIARAQQKSVQYQVAWQEWMQAGNTRVLARQLYYLQAQEAVAAAAARTSGKLYQAAAENLRLGDTTITTASLRQIAWLDSQDRALALGRQVTDTRQKLNQAIGLPPKMTLNIKPPQLWKRMPDAASLVKLADRHRLDLVALRAGYQAQEARVRRAILGQYPGFTIGFGKAADTSNVQSYSPSLTLDIPLWNRNRGAIAESEATRTQLRAAYSARLFQTRADIYRLVADLHRLTQEILPLQQQVPELEKAENRLRKAAAEHDVTLLDYETIRSQSLAKRLQLLALQESYAAQQAALEMAVGVPYADWESQK